MPSMLERTRQMARDCDLTNREVAKRARVGFEWFRKFKGGAYPNPRFKQVERLHDFLSQYMAARAEFRRQFDASQAASQEQPPTS